VSTKTDDTLRKETPGLRPDQIEEARRRWTPENLMRRILNTEADALIATHRITLETCSSDELKTIQGKIAGIKEMTGRINSQEE
jgi:hypothetical protein